MKKLRQSGEDYLEAILILSQKGEVRSIDIANEMNVSKPSVCRAVGILKGGGFINVDERGYITFTPDGKKTAETVYERHTVLTEWLMSLGVDKDTAAEDACRLEHDFSETSFEKLKESMQSKTKKRSKK